MTAAPSLVQHSMLSNEHYSPAAIVEAARATLGGIDLDPASCALANESVKAARFFTEAENGRHQNWDNAHTPSTVFLNPPGGFLDKLGKPAKRGKSSAVTWWFKLAQEYAAGRVLSAIFVGFSIDILQTTQGENNALPLPLDFPLCFPSSRVAYDHPVEGGGVESGGCPPGPSVIVYLPPHAALRAHLDDFYKHFGPLGRCGRM